MKLRYVQVVVEDLVWASFKYMAAMEHLTAKEKLLRMIAREALGKYEAESMSTDEECKPHVEAE